MSSAQLPLWTFLRSREEFGDTSLPILTITSEHGVAVRDLSQGGRAVSEDLGAYRVVRSGDLVVNKLWARFGAYAVSEHVGLISPAYWVLRVDSIVNPRYLHHVLRSDIYKGEIDRLSKNQPPNGFDIAWFDFRKISIAVPDAVEQGRVADFLDDQVARIDNVIAARETQIRGVVELSASQIEGVLQDDAHVWGLAPLRRWTTGIEQGWSPESESRVANPDEPAILKLSAVRAGRFNPDENKAMSEGTRPDPRYEVRRGDLLVSRANTPDLVGDSAVVRSDATGRYLPDLLYRVRTSDSSPDYLSAAIRGRLNRSLIRGLARGTSQSMAKLRGDDVLNLRIPAAPLAIRTEHAGRFEEWGVEAQATVSSMRKAITRLAELKRSLITAAVSGEFDVSSADGSRVPV